MNKVDYLTRDEVLALLSTDLDWRARTALLDKADDAQFRAATVCIPKPSRGVYYLYAGSVQLFPLRYLEARDIRDAIAKKSRPPLRPWTVSYFVPSDPPDYFTVRRQWAHVTAISALAAREALSATTTVYDVRPGHLREAAPFEPKITEAEKLLSDRGIDPDDSLEEARKKLKEGDITWTK